MFPDEDGAESHGFFKRARALVNRTAAPALAAKSNRAYATAHMTDERAMKALRRIEQAIGRIEATADRPRPTAPAARDDSELLRLRQQHQTLRQQVEGAIGEIDRLLEDAG